MCLERFIVHFYSFLLTLTDDIQDKLVLMLTLSYDDKLVLNIDFENKNISADSLQDSNLRKNVINSKH